VIDSTLRKTKPDSAPVSPAELRHLRHRLLCRSCLRFASNTPSLAIFVLFAAVLAGASAVGTFAGPLPPTYHDEFSYLLQADTFAEGRLANPPHPMARHFESFHIIQEPTYASKYPPAQGAILAVGQVLVGEPAAGSWLAVALMCAATLWMLLAWIPARWAFFGGILVALHFGMVGYWAQGYWGGAVPAAGGALLFGAVRRLWDGPKVGASMLLALGIVILAASRPYEGLVVCIAGGAILAVRLLKGPRRRWLTRTILPAGVVLGAGSSLLVTYNDAVTGSRWTIPYSVHMARYALAPNFLTQDPPERPVAFVDDRLRQFQVGYELALYEKQQTIPGFFSELGTKAGKLADTFAWGPPYIPPFLRWPSLIWAPLLFVPFAWRRRPWLWVAGGTILLVVAAEMFVTYSGGHYFGPIMALVFLLIVHGLRAAVVGIRALRKRWHLWTAVLLGSVGMSMGAGILIHHHLNSVPELWTNQRRHVIGAVGVVPGDHIVLVAYDPDYSIHWEWVYNSAEIDAQRIIWARALDPATDSVLVDYYPARTAWRLFLTPDEPPDLTRFEVSE